MENAKHYLLALVKMCSNVPKRTQKYLNENKYLKEKSVMSVGK
jgi:hypothetical protein